MAKHLTDLPRNVIDGAISGETEHLAFVLGYFIGYIKKACNPDTQRRVRE